MPGSASLQIRVNLAGIFVQAWAHFSEFKCSKTDIGKMKHAGHLQFGYNLCDSFDSFQEQATLYSAELTPFSILEVPVHGRVL
jgi:hypothetical protein